MPLFSEMEIEPFAEWNGERYILPAFAWPGGYPIVYYAQDGWVVGLSEHAMYAMYALSAGASEGYPRARQVSTGA